MLDIKSEYRLTVCVIVISVQVANSYALTIKMQPFTVNEDTNSRGDIVLKALRYVFRMAIDFASTNWNQNRLSISELISLKRCLTQKPFLYLSTVLPTSSSMLPIVFSSLQRLNVTKHFARWRAAHRERACFDRNDESCLRHAINTNILCAQSLTTIDWRMSIDLLIDNAIARVVITRFPFSLTQTPALKMASLLFKGFKSGLNIISQLMSMCQSSKSRGVHIGNWINPLNGLGMRAEPSKNIQFHVRHRLKLFHWFINSPIDIESAEKRKEREREREEAPKKCATASCAAYKTFGHMVLSSHKCDWRNSTNQKQRRTAIQMVKSHECSVVGRKVYPHIEMQTSFRILANVFQCHVFSDRNSSFIRVPFFLSIFNIRYTSTTWFAT